MKDIKQNFSLKTRLDPWVDLGNCADAKNQLFKDIVMFHINLKSMKHTITCQELYCPYSHCQHMGWGQNNFFWKWSCCISN